MIFEFTASFNFDFISGFAKKLNIKIRNNRLTIPSSLGKGYIKKVEFGPDFRMLLHNYNLKEELIIRRNAAKEKNDLISIFFNSNEMPLNLVYNDQQYIQFSKNNDSAIQVTTSDLNSEIRFPAHMDIFYIVIGIKASLLGELLTIDEPNSIVKKITSGTGSYLYFESMNQETQRILKQISEITEQDQLNNFYYKIKMQELIYLLFDKLIKRDSGIQKTLNNADVEKLLLIRNQILVDLSKPPVLKELSEFAGMSETKMKQLFKQTFGDTIYNYYQKIRMEEAAFLLKHAGYSVSEVGFQLGFSNLSHFSRLFEKHYGLTPKKYSSVG